MKKTKNLLKTEIPKIKDVNSSIKFVKQNSKEGYISLATHYQSLLKIKKNQLINECLDFSKITPQRKKELNFLINSATTFEPIIDIYTMFSEIVKRKSTPKKRLKASCKFDRYEDNDIYTYGIIQTRELLYLSSINFPNLTFDSKIIIEPVFEKINLFNSCYTFHNIKEVVDKLNLEHVKILIN